MDNDTGSAPPEQRSTLFTKNGRIRPTLRVIFYLVLIFVCLFVFVDVPFSALLLSGVIPLTAIQNQDISGLLSVLQNLLLLIAFFIATFVARRFLDRRSFVSLGFERRNGWVADLLVGLGLGFGLQALIFIVELATGLVKVNAVGPAASGSGGLALIFVFLVFVIVGFNEELMNRGYILQNLAEGWGTPAAVMISSIIFALLHWSNPNVGSIALPNLFIAGVLFAVGYLVTRSLWLPIGLHFAWNFAEGPIFGFPVSGLQTARFMSTTQSGPDILTGGAFGPEGGLICLVVMFIGIGILLFWQRMRPGRATLGDINR
jgi:uncharacterized protein